MRWKWILPAGLALAVTMALGAPGAKAAEKATLMLNWFPIADHTPLFLAKKRGYYADEGIDLEIVRGFGSGDTTKKIDLKQAEFGIADIPTVITGISKGADVKVIGVVFDKAANNMFFFKDAGINSVKDLPGKKIAAPPGDSHRFLWPALAKANGVDPESITLVNVKPEGKVGIVAAEQVDAAFDLYTGKDIWEKALGKGNVGNLLFADHGISLYGHGYLANTETLEKNPDLVRGFLKATYKGWRDAAKEPDAAVDALVEEVDGVDRDSYRKSLDLVLELCVTDRSRELGLGMIDAAAMQQTIDITASGGKLDREVSLSEVYTNEFNSKIMP